jgi:putative FmdB family regulatory protein
MPILACRCAACGKDFEFLSLGAGDPPTCPECRGRDVVRKLTTFAVASGPSAAEAGPSCSGDPGSCGRCGGGFADA